MASKRLNTSLILAAAALVLIIAFVAVQGARESRGLSAGSISEEVR
jgi:hypothetical protein